MTASASWRGSWGVKRSANRAGLVDFDQKSLVVVSMQKLGL
jgi:hypothetical protein